MSRTRIAQSDARSGGQAALRIRQFAVISLIWALATIGLGTLVVSSDSSTGCAGWPLCNGSLAAPGNGAGAANITHRLAALVLLLGLGFLAFMAYKALPATSSLVRLTAGIFAVGLTQAVLGGLAVAYDFPTWISALHLALSLTIVTGLIALVIDIGSRREAVEATGGLTTAAAAGALALFGALTAGAASQHEVFPPLPALGTSWGLSGAHYALVAFAAVAVFFVLRISWRQRESPSLRYGLVAATALFASLASGIVVAETGASAGYNALPVTLAVLAFCALASVLLLNVEFSASSILSGDSNLQSVAVKGLVRDFFRVTKPGIMLLLLTTTLGGMLVAAEGWPGFGLVMLTLIGGAFASGGASALNCYVDRDIDQVMARTRKRPIPTGGLTPEQVRGFALLLSALAVLLLLTFVNPVAALLALSGNLFYILIYTLWLKRSTPQNIVIGGAAGSFPPLVGWAAVTGSLGITPLLIAAIIFYWTPPHFWSLALLKANDYRKANIPMLPVTHGAQATRKSILLYAILLVSITLLIVPAAGSLGVIYLGAAAILGALFLMYALRMYREGTNRLAWKLFKYSNYYLAALLAVMVLDSILNI